MFCFALGETEHSGEMHDILRDGLKRHAALVADTGEREERGVAVALLRPLGNLLDEVGIEAPLCMGCNSRTNGLCPRMNRFLRARPGHADGLRECCNRHVRPDAVGAASLPEFRQAADNAIRMRDARREIRVKAMPAEHLQESVVDALQQSLGPVVCLDRLLQHVNKMHAVTRIDEIRRAMAEEIRITEAAQLLRRDVIQVDVETGSRLHQGLQGIRVVVGHRVDVGIPASTCIQQHVHHIIIAAHALPLLGLRVHGAELEIRLVFNVAEDLVVKTARRDRRIPRLQIFRLPLRILPRVSCHSSHRPTPVRIFIFAIQKGLPLSDRP